MCKHTSKYSNNEIALPLLLATRTLIATTGRRSVDAIVVSKLCGWRKHVGTEEALRTAHYTNGPRLPNQAGNTRKQLQKDEASDWV